MKPRLSFLLALACLGTPVAVLNAASAAPIVTLTRVFDRVRVEIGGQLFTEYVFADGASRPSS